MIITKERDDKTFSRGSALTRSEFPKLILEEENVSRSEIEKSVEKTLSTREIITFLLFCIFFIIIVYLQVNIGESYNINNSILIGLQKNPQDFETINIEDSYWAWLDYFVNSLYEDEYYQNFTIQPGKRHAVPNLNILSTPIRITQRRMKLVPNDDYYTQAYISQGWASLGFDYLDEFDADAETTDPFGKQTQSSQKYQYQLSSTYGGKGGYLQILDTDKMNQTQASNFVKSLKNNGFIDKQTRSIVIDMALYNSYNDFFAMVNFIAVFQANGLISTNIQIYDLKRDYYEQEGAGYFRFICEICFCCLLIFYFIIEFIEIINDIRSQKRDHEKELKRRQARENRKRDLLEQHRLNLEAGAIDKNGEATEPISKSDTLGRTPQLGRSRGKALEAKYDGDRTPDGFDALDLKDPTKRSQKEGIKKKLGLHYCKFIIGGIKAHYNDGWNWIDSMYLILSLVAVSIWGDIARQHITGISTKSFDDIRNIQSLEVFLKVSQQFVIYSRICSINFILIFIKVLKYLASWFERVMIIFKTLSYAQSDIFYFLIMYIIIFFAFVVMCHIYYGADLSDFGTIFNSLTTLFLMLLGDLDALDDMIVLNKVLSFFFFIAFMTSMQFILINMFIAFISNAYSAVNESISSSRKIEDELKQTHPLVKVQEWFRNLRNALSKRAAAKRQQQARNSKQQELIKKNLQTKLHKAMMQAQGNQPSESKAEGEPKEVRKERFVFGGTDVGKLFGANQDDSVFSDEGAEGNSMENQNISELALGIEIFDEKKQRKRSGTTNTNELTSRIEDVDENDLDSPQNSDSTDENLSKSRQRIEEEKAKIILTRKEWDKNFDQNQFFVEEPLLPAMLSEKQDVQGKKERELKCGKIMWASITFTLYAALYISLILFQLNVERNYWYNTAIQNAILGLADDNLNTIEGITVYGDLVTWLNVSLPTLVTPITQQQTNFSGFYIQDVNYVLGDELRLCFKFSKASTSKSTANSTHESQYEKDDESEDDEQTTTFTGKSSGIVYQYSGGFQKTGGYCQDFSFDSNIYQDQIDDFIADHIISDQLLQLTLEFVSFEASQQVHTYSTVVFEFPDDGSIDQNINIYTMRLNQYKTRGDMVRLGFEALYLLLLGYNMVIFVRKLLSKGRQYSRWKHIEIDSLSEIERKQRFKKAPEWIRKWNALFTAFTYFDIIYFSLAVASITIWVLYINSAAEVDFNLPPSEENRGFIPKFYEVQQLLMNYTNVVAINTIFLSVKVFDYMNKSKHMNMLSNTLYSSKEDTFYFLIIFAIFLFGFVGMAYISFGAMLEDFNSIGNAVRKCFEITIGDFNYKQLNQTNAPMAVLFFFPFNVLFVFILTNIFLAIINEAYEANQLSSEDYDNLSVLSSVFYCLIAANNNDKNSKGKRKATGIDKKQQHNDYLEVFEKLVVNLQISMSDLKAWAINCADEIKSELKKRTQLRHENREILLNKFKKMKSVEEGRGAGTGVIANGKRYDEVECYKKRLQYWDYIRNGIQFISFQNKILSAVLKQKEREIEAKTEEYYREKEKTQEIYKYLALLEKPVEDRLEQIMNYRKVLQLLEQEKNLLLNEEEKEEDGAATAGNEDDKAGEEQDAMSANPSSKNDKGSGVGGRPSAKTEFSK